MIIRQSRKRLCHFPRGGTGIPMLTCAQASALPRTLSHTGCIRAPAMQLKLSYPQDAVFECVKIQRRNFVSILGTPGRLILEAMPGKQRIR